MPKSKLLVGTLTWFPDWSSFDLPSLTSGSVRGLESHRENRLVGVGRPQTSCLGSLRALSCHIQAASLPGTIPQPHTVLDQASNRLVPNTALGTQEGNGRWHLSQDGALRRQWLAAGSRKQPSRGAHGSVELSADLCVGTALPWSCWESPGGLDDHFKRRCGMT